MALVSIPYWFIAEQGPMLLAFK